MNAAPLIDADHKDEIRQGPGSRLRQARLSKGLEVSRMAAQLHLGDAMVEALEKDDYDSLPGPVFTRGYLSNYSRLLGLDSQQILDDYERLVPADADGSPLAQKSRIKADVKSSHLLVRTVTWLLVMLVIGLLVVWWQGRLSWPLYDSTPVGTSTDSLPMVDEATELPDETLVPVVTPVAEAEPEWEQPQEQGIEPAIVAAPRNQGAPGVSDPVPTEAEPAPAVEVAPVVEPTAVVDTEPSEEPRSAVASASIEFLFSASSWLDVRDASGENKIIGVMGKDTRRTLTGVPPFSVVLGNARVVEVLVNGQPYDVNVHIRGNVARFTVDPSRP